jgi:very-short-patch-repair endonuclease
MAHTRARAGKLHRLYRGVYAVGHTRLTLRGRWMAAVLACGPDAVLSHRAALALHELRPAPRGPIDVTVPARGRRSNARIRVHCVRQLNLRDHTTVDAIPVTTVARTLLDYAERAQPQALRLAVEEAVRLERLDGRVLEELLGRSHGRHGVTPLRNTLASMRGPAQWTQSELERRFLAWVRAIGLPEPQCNAPLAGEVADCYWAESGLVVELDSWDWHKTRERFEEDRRRDTALLLAGHPTVRVTQRRMTDEPRRLEYELRTLTARRAA